MKNKELKRGQIAISKKALINHCHIVHECLNDMDKIMSEKESVERGKKIAVAMNKLNLSLHSIERYELGVPLNKLGTKLIIK